MDKARVCHIKKSEGLEDYGFDLHHKKGQVGNIVGKVEPGSPAEKAGLKMDDRILEVRFDPSVSKTKAHSAEFASF